MQLFLYCCLLATQLVAAVAFARAAQGQEVSILKADGALPLTPAGGWLRAFGSAAAATLMVIGLITSRWIGWDIGVAVMVAFFYLELLRLQRWKGFSKTMMKWVICPLVLLFSLIDLATHL